MRWCCSVERPSFRNLNRASLWKDSWVPIMFTSKYALTVRESLVSPLLRMVCIPLIPGDKSPRNHSTFQAATSWSPHNKFKFRKNWFGEGTKVQSQRLVPLKVLGWSRTQIPPCNCDWNNDRQAVEDPGKRLALGLHLVSEVSRKVGWEGYLSFKEFYYESDHYMVHMWLASCIQPGSTMFKTSARE